ncbi:transporter [Kitasatospora sp. NPDC004615]|uniref:transporter n=1 Tax=Kitasatospora sp. NPDC004615 TaxID=3364017 RepID=UPI00369CC203
MIWLTWRQFRTQAVIGLAALLLLGGYLLVLGLGIQHAHQDVLEHCGGRDCAGPLGAFADRYRLRTDLLGYLLLVLPVVLGVFCGAPLVAREFEAGTHRLVWNQSITRRRWLAVKLAVVGGSCTLAVALVSLLLGWATGPVVAVEGARFEPVAFASHGLVPAAYAAFASVLGATLGLHLRRTVPAMATTLAVFTAVQLAVPALVRPHYQAPERTSVQLTAPIVANLSKIGTYGDIGGLRVPGGPWVIDTSAILDESGAPVGHSDWFQDCMDHSSLADLPRCLADHRIHVEITQQPADRYWTFQVVESALFALLTAFAAALAVRRLRTRAD